MAEFDYVRPGQPMKIPASAWNTMIDAARGFLRAKNFVGSSGVEDPPNPVIVKVKNATGGSISRFCPIELSDATILPTNNESEFFSKKVLNGVKPTAPSGRKSPVVVTLEGIEDGNIGEAVLIGVVACIIDVSSGHEWDTYAEAAEDDILTLHAGVSGFARILWKESGAGAKKAILLLTGDVTGEDAWFLADVTDRHGVSNLYGFSELEFLADGTTAVKSGGRTGSVGAYVGNEWVTWGDDDTIEVQKITVANATSGNWTLGATSLAFSCNFADVQAAVDTALGPGIATVTGANPFTITYGAFGYQPLLDTGDGTLKPGPRNALKEVQGEVIPIPSKEWVRPGYKANPKFVLEKIQVGNFVDEPTKWSLYLFDWASGTYSLTANAGTAEEVAFDGDASAIAAAILASDSMVVTITGAGSVGDPFIIENGDNFDDHELVGDSSGLVDKTYYRFRAGYRSCPGKLVSGWNPSLTNVLRLNEDGCLAIIPTAECSVDDEEELIIDGGTL